MPQGKIDARKPNSGRNQIKTPVSAKPAATKASAKQPSKQIRVVSADEKRLRALAKSKQARDREQAAGDKRCPQDVLASLLKDVGSWAGELAARNPSLPAYAVLNLPAKSLLRPRAQRERSDLDLMLAAASDEACPPALLSKLTKSQYVLVRVAAARNRTTSARNLSVLAKDKVVDVRIATASNANASRSLIAGLVGDQDAEVRRQAARHPHLSPDQILTLSRSNDVAIRLGLALNPSAPREALVRLALDSNPLVGAAVARNSQADSELKHLWEDAEDGASLAEWVSDGNPSAELLSVLVDKAEWHSYIAQARRCPPALLGTIAKQSKDTHALWWVAMHHNCPVDAMRRLARHVDPEVRAAIASNRQAPVDIRALADSFNQQARRLP